MELTIERRKPLPRSTKRLPRSPITKRRTVKRFACLRDESYANWIRRRPCLLSRLKECDGVVEGCHFKTRSTGGNDVGNMFPACTKHHRIQHAVGIKSFQSMYGLDLATTCRELGEWYADEECAF